MAIKIPNTSINLGASRKATERKSIYLDIPMNGSKQVRFTPLDNEDGLLFRYVGLHYKFKEDGQDRAYACTRVHGDSEKCAFCDVIDFFKKTGNKAEKDIVDSFKGFGLSENFYIQVIEKETADEGSKLLRVPRGFTDEAHNLEAMRQQNGMTSLVDPVDGEWFVVGKSNSTGKVKWSIMGTSRVASLDSILPTWQEKFIEDIIAAVNPKILSREEQIQALRNNYGTTLTLDKVPALKK